MQAKRLKKRFQNVLYLTLFAVLSGATACSTHSVEQEKWSVRELARSPHSKVRLIDTNQRVITEIDTLQIKKLLLAKLRITRIAGIQAELFIEKGKEPNAYAGYVRSQGYGGKGKPIMVITTGMIKVLGDDTDAAAFLLGHEAAHFTKRHHESARTRSQTLAVAGQAAAYGLAAAGVPMGGNISGVAVDLIDSAYSRDDEREADALAMDYVVAAGYDPRGALRLQKALKKAGNTAPIPFLSTHPSYSERIENLEGLIKEKGGTEASRSMRRR